MPHRHPTAMHPVKRFHQVLLWPLRLMPVKGQSGAPTRPWRLLRELSEANGAQCPWHEVVDDFTGDTGQFHERHYQEFVTFLPYVQRFLYGDGRAGHHDTEGSTGSPMRVFRRHDVAQVRITLRPGQAPLVLDVIHIDLYFFYDVDVVLLNVEVAADNLTLAQAQELLYRFGRGYPSGWDPQGRPLHCVAQAEWLDAQGQVLAESDSRFRDRFLSHVAEHRAARIADHWAFLLHPLVSDHSDAKGALRFRQIEYYRMPVMGYLAVDDPKALARDDFVRLGLGTGAGENGSAVDEEILIDFESRHSDNRFWRPSGAAPYTRYLCTGNTLVVVGRADAEFFTCRDRGVLAQFRHQHFLIFLIAHFQRAALLMFSDRLVEALRNLSVGDTESVKAFKRVIRASFESFLRFTHRYWFHEVAKQALTRSLFERTAAQLSLDSLYAEVKERVTDMNAYLETDSVRRQANTVVRLTVVTIFGLVGTITTGFLGMNLLAEAEAPMLRRVVVFTLTLGVTCALTVYTMVKSKRLSDFLDALSDDRLSTWQKCKAFVDVWRG